MPWNARGDPSTGTSATGFPGRHGYIRLGFAFGGEEPCCNGGEHDDDEADDYAPTMQSNSLATSPLLRVRIRHWQERVWDDAYPFAMLIAV